MNNPSPDRYYGMATGKFKQPFQVGDSVTVILPGRTDLLRAGDVAKVEACYRTGRQWHVDLYCEATRASGSMLIEQVEARS